MKFNVSHKLNDFSGLFVCHVVGPLLDAAHAGKGPEVDPSNLDIEVKINGVEVDFQSFIDNIEAQMERMVQEQAKELLQKSGLHKVYDALHELENHVADVIREKLPLARRGDGYE